jgi:UDPglucose 6-dehydrogenase
LWTLRGKRLAVLGLAFKGDTDDIRESPAIDLVEMLLAEGCTVVAYDPAAMKRAQSELPPSGQMIYVTGIEEAAKDADALLILTDWREFARIDLRQLHAIMRYPIIIDGRNLYDPQDMVNNDFTYLSIGRPAATPSREPAVLAV